MAANPRKRKVDNPSGKTCPNDEKPLVATRIVRHKQPSGMYWVCECGYMRPVR